MIYCFFFTLLDTYIKSIVSHITLDISGHQIRTLAIYILVAINYYMEKSRAQSPTPFLFVFIWRLILDCIRTSLKCHKET